MMRQLIALFSHVLIVFLSVRTFSSDAQRARRILIVITTILLKEKKKKTRIILLKNHLLVIYVQTYESFWRCFAILFLSQFIRIEMVLLLQGPS